MNFINPVPDSYLTSPFGWRTHPVTGRKNSFHQGVDLARQPNTNVEVLAAADGEVIRVGALGTYGNVVMIKHNINGKRMDTNYAHLKDGSILVKVGQKVKQGQRIATMGNTGSSTAPHLHFEIHNGAWATGQPNAVDPAKYIKFYTKKEVEKMEKRIAELEKQVKILSEALNAVAERTNNAAQYNSNEQPSEYALGALKWAKDVCVLQGDTSGNLNPQGALKRQDMAIILQRFYEQVIKKHIKNEVEPLKKQSNK